MGGRSEDAYTNCIDTILGSTIDIINCVTKREIRKLQLWHEQELAEKERELRSAWDQESSWQNMNPSSSPAYAASFGPSFGPSFSLPPSSSNSHDGPSSMYLNPFKKSKSKSDSDANYPLTGGCSSSVHGSLGPTFTVYQGAQLSQRDNSSPVNSVTSTSTTSTTIEQFPSPITKQDKDENDNENKNKIQLPKNGDGGENVKEVIGVKRKARKVVTPDPALISALPPQQDSKPVKRKLNCTKYEIGDTTYKVGDKYLIRTVTDLNEKGFKEVYKIRSFIKCSDDPDSIYVEIKQPTTSNSLIYIRNLHWLHEEDKIRALQ